MNEVDQIIADRIVKEAKARMTAVPEGFGCTVLLTTQGNLYSEAIPQIDGDAWEERLLEQLSQAGDTEVEYIFCYPFGVPTRRLGKLLPELHPHNREAAVLGRSLQGGYLSRPLRTFLPNTTAITIEK